VVRNEGSLKAAVGKTMASGRGFAALVPVSELLIRTILVQVDKSCLKNINIYK